MTSRCRRNAPPSTPPCSRRRNWPCSRAPGTIPGWTTRSGSCGPWPGSCAESERNRGEVPAAEVGGDEDVAAQGDVRGVREQVRGRVLGEGADLAGGGDREDLAGVVEGDGQGAVAAVRD